MGQEETQEPIESEAPEQEESLEEGQAEDIQEAQSEESPEPETFEVDGEKYTAEQIKELKEGALRQEDYTRKTQELAELRKKYEGQQGQESEYEKYPEDQRESVKFVDERARVQAELQAREATSPIIERLERMEMDKEVSDIQSKYDLSDKELSEVKKVAGEMKLDIGELEYAYKSWAFDKKIPEAKQEGERRAVKNIQDRRSALTMKTSSGQPKIDTSKMNYEQLTEYLKTNG